MYLYINCNKNILLVKKCLSILWVFTDFPILLVALLNTNTTITRQLIRTARNLEAECWQVSVKRGFGDKGRRVKDWARLGCYISPCYGPFSLGAGFETYETLVCLIFQILGGLGKLQICWSACICFIVLLFSCLSLVVLLLLQRYSHFF